LELDGIKVDYSEDETRILLGFKTEKNNFSMSLKPDVQDDITKEGMYKLAGDIMGKLLFHARYFDRKYPNGCETDVAMKEVAEKMPDIIEAISKKEPYEYKKGE
jgi:hypothetical protein